MCFVVKAECGGERLRRVLTPLCSRLLPTPGTAISDFAGDLKDGVLLCKCVVLRARAGEGHFAGDVLFTADASLATPRAMNVLQPGAVKKINETKMPFKQVRPGRRSSCGEHRADDAKDID